MSLQSALVTGRVYGSDRVPLARVAVSQLDGRVLTVTNDDGLYSIQTRHDGPAALVFSHPDYAHSIVPIARTDRVVLDRGVALDGRIHDVFGSNDAPVTVDLFREIVNHAAVALHRCDTLQIAPDTSHFTIPHVAIGRYLVLLRGAERFQQLVRRFAITSAETSIHLVMYRFPLRIVVTRNAAPLPNAVVTLRPACDPVAARVWHPSAITDVAGAIEADMWQAGSVVADIAHTTFDDVFRAQGILDSQHPSWTIDVAV